MFTFTVEKTMKFLFLIAILLTLSLSSSAHKFETKYALIDHPWLRVVGEKSSIAAGYFELTNKGDKSIIFIGAKAEFAKKIELHEIKMENGISKMRPIMNGIKVGAGDTLELKPMGHHLMFFGLKKRLEKGQMIEVKLLFKNAEALDVQFKIDSVKTNYEHNH